MKIQCPLDEWHDLSPTALALVVSAYAAGDLQTIGKDGLASASVCILAALTQERIDEFKRKYPGNNITAEGKVMA